MYILYASIAVLYNKSWCTGVTGQNIPRPEYTRVHYGLGKFKLLPGYILA